MLQRLVLIIMAAFVLHGCASDGDELPAPNPFKPDANERRLARANAQQLYKAARKALDSGDYANALAFYSRLDASYPFTPEATQGQLEGVFARFRSFETDAAISAADRFLRAHPRHPNVDYVLYLRGLVYFENTATDILDLLDVDSVGRDPVDARRAFEEFSRLIQAYPNSQYAPDARARMIWLRERIAAHYFSIADYYRRRGAWVAAIRRGEEILEQFRDTKVALKAIALLEESYAELKLDEQASAMRKLLKANGEAATSTKAVPKPPSTVTPPPQISTPEQTNVEKEASAAPTQEAEVEAATGEDSAAEEPAPESRLKRIPQMEPIPYGTE